MTLSIASHFSNNSLFIFNGLKSTDFQTARHLHDELRDFVQQQPMPTVIYKDVGSKKELLFSLGQIEQEVKTNGAKPIVHIEAHGDEVSGLTVGNDQENVPWSTLSKAIQSINVASQNNTGLVLAACHGINAIKPLTITEPAPFYFLLGSQRKVSAVLIDDEMKRFYQCLYASGSLSEAMLGVDQAFQQFHAERFFCKLMADYFATGCVGKDSARRRERLISEAVGEGASADPASLKLLRQIAKSAVKPSQEVFDRYSNVFLHGRHSIPYAEFLDFVRSTKKR